MEQHEQTWKPATKELEIINIGNDQFKKELKIEASTTPKDKAEMITLLQEYTYVFSWFVYGYRSTQNITGRKMQIRQTKVKKDSS